MKKPANEKVAPENWYPAKIGKVGVAGVGTGVVVETGLAELGPVGTGDVQLDRGQRGG